MRRSGSSRRRLANSRSCALSILPLLMRRNFTFLVRAAAAFTLVLVWAGCSSPLAQRAQRADGLLDFILGSPGPDVIPVERVSRMGGRIVSAHTSANDGRLRVGGIVRKDSLVQPPPGSHIDILIIDSHGRVMSGIATDFFPRPLPYASSRYGPGNAHYAAYFPAIPTPGSTARIVFHGTPKRDCELSPST